MKRYDHKKIEPKWQKEWEKQKIYKTEDDFSKKKFYVLDMFPYPSGEGLHVGHPRGYIATDIYSRHMRMRGFNVLHPMGWDAFGLPAENYAIKNKIHPRLAVEKNIARFKEQLSALGLDYDWSREINTTDPDYYRWTQWIFLKLFEKGLAYESNESINWCPSCQTGLANEDVENGRCERCGALVIKKKIKQWVLKITDYAERLLSDLNTLNWPQSIKESQRNWIGKSEGLIFTAPVKDLKLKLETFSAHFESCFADTFVVIAPDHPLLPKLIEGVPNEREIAHYAEDLVLKRMSEPYAVEREVEGMFTGRFILDPLGNGNLPIWIANFALADYGTGVVKCSAHDKRDFVFAKKYGIPLKPVLFPQDAKERERVKNLEYPYTDFENGVLSLPKEFADRPAREVREELIAYLEKKGYARRAVSYRLRDWVFSRQRYWGEPIPIIHCQKCGAVPVPEKDLPVRLPEVDHYEPAGTGESPLATIKKWVDVSCPKCDGRGKRETNTMPQWAGSSWYYLRYIDPKNTKVLADKNKLDYWIGCRPAPSEHCVGGVDLYVGGTEHATRHLIYARFWHKFLFDIGVVSIPEPFALLRNQGLILASDGKKMSKRFGNVINPDDIIQRFGADALRLYESFIGPFSQTIPWNENGPVGTYRFLERIWAAQERVTHNAVSLELRENRYGTAIINGLAAFEFNTCVSDFMKWSNEWKGKDAIAQTEYELFLRLLAPFAPHIAEEIWHEIGHTTSIHLEPWPALDPKKVKDEMITIAVEINGKSRAIIHVRSNLSQEEVVTIALAQEKVKRYVPEGKYQRIVYVPGRVLNFIV